MSEPTNMPPRWFHKFFRWYCHPKLRDHIEGDLLEVYGENVKMEGKRKADLRFILDVILLVRPAIIRPAEGYQSLNTYGMYKSYLKVGWRNLLRNKGYSIINISGLAIGMSVAMLNGLLIWHELSFNKEFDNYDRIAHVAERGIDTEKGGHWVATTVMYPLGTDLMTNYAQHFHRIARTSWDLDYILSSKETNISAKGLYVDKDFPQIFTFKMQSGYRDALKNPKAILLSASIAKSLFGNEDPINKIVRINNNDEQIVAGVYEDFPDNSKFRTLQFVAPWEVFLSNNPWIEQRAQNDWRNHFMKIYVEIPEGKLLEEINAHVRPALQFAPEDQQKASEMQKELYLYPMKDWHLHPEASGRFRYDPILMIKLVGLIGIFVLILACINFMNLSTARSEKRAKEVAIRKTIGSVRLQLIQQFFSESMLIASFSFVVALMVTAAMLPVFNNIATKQIEMPWSNPMFWCAGAGFVFITGFLAGSYPAIYLSSFNPIVTLKGTLRMGRFAAAPRKVLVVFQFCISVVLIIGTAIVYQQIQYAKERPVGYAREGLIMVQKKSIDFFGKYEALRNELKATGAVVEVSESMGPMTEVVSGNNGWDWQGKNPNTDVSFATLAVSHLHGKTAGWQFLMGRDFDVSQAADSTGIIINESALKYMGLKNPIGEQLTWTWWRDQRKLDYKIIGVVKDMVMESPYAPAEPTVFYLKGFNGVPNWINIRLVPGASLPDALTKVERVFKRVIPTAPFEYKFADQEYNMKFGKEERIGNIALIFALLAVIISALGLFGLASFTAEQRTKEIGIRKVLGATVSNVWTMLSRDFVLLVFISCIVAAPLSYYLFSRWLENFAYRIEISPWTFVLTGAGAIVLTLLTVSYQAVRAALANPVKSLRSE
ncbi:MAG TPA: FtsX-like permease family protein [Chryseosolibacter sp.]